MPQRRSFQLRGDADRRADVVYRIPAGKQQVGRQLVQGGGKVMAELLEPAAQHAVIENEPAIIFEDAQSLAGPIGAGVNDSGDIHRFGRLGKEQRRVQKQRRRGLGCCRK